MVDPIGGLSSAQLDALTSVYGSGTVASFVSYVEQGLSADRAYLLAFGNHGAHDGEANGQAIARAFDTMPTDVQRRIVDDADSLPRPVREALEQRDNGNSEPQRRAQERFTAEAANARGRAGAGNAQAAPLGPDTARGKDAGREIVLQATFADQKTAFAQQADRDSDAITLLPPNARTAEGTTGQIPDPHQVVIMADRLDGPQRRLQAMPTTQPRADALTAALLAAPAAMPVLAGAAMLGGPQANPAPRQGATPTAPTPPGTDAAAAQAREGRLAAASHTLAAGLRSGQRRPPTRPQPRRFSSEGLTALLPGRRRHAGDEQETTSFLWLFWILTVLAYGALGVAAFAIVTGPGGLLDEAGKPRYGMYALAIGALGALGSWLIGRRIFRRH